MWAFLGELGGQQPGPVVDKQNAIGGGGGGRGICTAPITSHPP
jgi:hypothetical protein